MNWEQRERQKLAERRERHAQVEASKQFKQDFRELMKMEPMRRLLNQILRGMAVDGSPFNTNAMAQSHAIGMQDAAKWWLNNVRDLCPEQEVRMRNESALADREAAKLQQEVSDDEQ